MTDSLFNAPDPTGDTPAADPNKDYLAELVGEGKKFKDPNELARGKAEADAFIARLTREQEELRKELNTRLTLEQYLEKMGTNQQSGRSDHQLNEPKGSDPDTSGLTPTDVEALIERKVSERETQRIQKQNREDARARLVQAFGNDYISKLKEAGENLGLSAERLDQIAAENPKAFLKLVGADTAPAQQRSQDSLFVPPQGQSNGTPVVTGDRTKKYYDDLKRKDPKGYWDARTQNQLHKDALRLGESFFDS